MKSVQRGLKHGLKAGRSERGACLLIGQPINARPHFGDRFSCLGCQETGHACLGSRAGRHVGQGKIVTDASGEQSDRHGFNPSSKRSGNPYASTITFPIDFVKIGSLLFPSCFRNTSAHGPVKDYRVSQVVSTLYLPDKGEFVQLMRYAGCLPGLSHAGRSDGLAGRSTLWPRAGQGT